MADIATCAKCGDVKELCGGCRDDGLMQPRICKDCLLTRMRTGDKTIIDMYWLAQMGQLDYTESIAIMSKQLGVVL